MWVTMDLARRLEACDANHAAEYVRARLLSDPQFPGDICRIAGGMAIRSGPDSPMNFAVGIGLGVGVSAADVQAIEEFFLTAATPPLFKLSPWADRELWSLLKSQGYGVSDFLNVWVLPLKDWVPDDCADDDEIIIHEVGHDAAEVWADTVSTGFDGRMPTARDRAFLRGFYDSASTTAFLATWGDNPVAAGTVSTHEGVGMLFNASTIDGYRSRGLQMRLIHQRLAHAQRRGCDLAMVQATPGSASDRNIARAGFQLAYTKLFVQ